MKRQTLNLKLLTLTIGFMVATFVSLVPVAEPVSAATYELGDTGPAGGLIFYIDGDTYYEAAPADWDGGADPYAAWGCRGTSLAGADGTAIGTGEQNTADILAGCATAGIAARLAADYVGGGYDDWFLPSSDELTAMYQNLYSQALGGFSWLYYWSSSEYSTIYARSYDFDFGGSHQTAKDDLSQTLVRPARSFTESPNPSATDSITISASLSSTISLSTSGSVNLNLTPHPSENRFWSQNDTVTVSTNNTTGYTLSIANGDADTALRSGGNSIPAHGNAPSNPVSISVQCCSQWAFRVDEGAFGPGPTEAETNANGSNWDWAGVPAADSSAAIKTTSDVATGDTTDIWYGVVIEPDQPAGTYTDTVVYTAVTN